MLGPDWAAAVPVLRVVCAAFGLSMVTMFAGVVCDATATLTPKLWLNLGYTGLLVGLFYGLSRYGLLGVAAAVVTGEVIRTGLYLLLMRRVLAVTVADVLGAYVPGLVAGGLVAGGLLGLRLLLPPLPAAVLLVAQMLTGAVLLLALAVGAPPARLRSVLHRLLGRVLEATPATGRFGQVLLALQQRLAQPTGTAAAAAASAPQPVRRAHPALLPDPETELA